MRWIPPSGSTYKLNVDAVVFTGMNASGFGTVVQNEEKEVMAALVGVLKYKTTRKLRR